MDASCGPSNGVKQLQRHFDTDRSLHQTQFRPGGGGEQERRFREGHSQEQLERARLEQEQFLAGAAARTREQAFSGPGLANGHLLGRIDRPGSSNTATANWANDFQHQVEQTPSLQRHLSPQTQMAHGGSAGGWEAEFMARQGTASYLSPASQQPSLFATQSFMGQPSMVSYGGMPSFANMTHRDDFYQQPIHSSASAAAVAEADRLAFTEAFAEAEASLHRITLDNAPDLLHHPASHLDQDEQQQQQGDHEELANPQTFFSEEDSQAAEELDRQVEADALASTAGELIHALRDEHSEKFKNSNFMALMHKLRDREVVVNQEDQMVDAASGSIIHSHRSDANSSSSPSLATTTTNRPLPPSSSSSPPLMFEE